MLRDSQGRAGKFVREGVCLGHISKRDELTRRERGKFGVRSPDGAEEASLIEHLRRSRRLVPIIRSPHRDQHLGIDILQCKAVQASHCHRDGPGCHVCPPTHLLYFILSDEIEATIISPPRVLPVCGYEPQSGRVLQHW